MHSIEDFLKTLFIVSDVVVCDEVTLDTCPTEWEFTAMLSLPGNSKCILFRSILLTHCLQTVKRT